MLNEKGAKRAVETSRPKTGADTPAQARATCAEGSAASLLLRWLGGVALIALPAASIAAVEGSAPAVATHEGDWATYTIQPRGRVKGGEVRLSILTIERQPDKPDRVSRWENENTPPDPPDTAFVNLVMDYSIRLPWYAGGQRRGRMRRTLPLRFFDEAFYQELERRGCGYLYLNAVRLSVLGREEHEGRAAYRVLFEAVSEASRKPRGFFARLFDFFRIFEVSVSDLPVDILYSFTPQVPGAGWIRGTMTIRRVPILGQLELPFVVDRYGSAAEPAAAGTTLATH
jgi:hypothetical protein